MELETKDRFDGIIRGSECKKGDVILDVWCFFSVYLYRPKLNFKHYGFDLHKVRILIRCMVYSRAVLLSPAVAPKIILLFKFCLKKSYI